MTSDATIRSVIRWLGVITFTLVLGNIWLLDHMLAQAAGKGTIDAAAVGAIAGLSAMIGAGIGALGALLVSTRSHPEPPAEPIPVVIEDQPVEVDEAGT